MGILFTGREILKIAGIRELRANSAALLGGDEPVVVTRHGKVSGVYLPLERSRFLWEAGEDMAEDAHVFTLARSLNLPIWTNDGDLTGKNVTCYPTAQLLRILKEQSGA
ncbi:type II toxin-antitoxin system Phd/YefM family antitoxin [Acidobacteria bacterium AH-259-A15]|nr:type II toxin-antitoxin system Phd/YefM family antitoxin [Acidobacteria bacterium AH-259-A15]